MPYERKGEEVKPGIYRVYNGSPVEVNMTESEINNAVDDRFGIGNIENQLCNEACQLL